jgi:thioesterase domain-containing protein
MAALLPSVAPRPAPASALPACLVPLRRSGSRPPLYLAHPLAGVVFPYIPISRALGDDQPVYGLQAAGIDGQEAADPTVEAMAARYVAGIRAVQPRGPYFLAGYSFGSYLAYEMALQLEAAGERVPLVALMDEVAPVEGNRPGLRTLASLAVGPEGRSFLQHLRDYLALGDREALRPSLRQWRGLLERAALATLLPDDAQNLVMGRPAMRPLLELAKIHWRETLRYAPLPRKGGVVLFKSEHWSRQPRIEKARWTHTLGWDALALGGVEVVPVSGDHLGMIRDPHAIRLAAGLRAAMNHVLKGPPPAAP